MKKKTFLILFVILVVLCVGYLKKENNSDILDKNKEQNLTLNSKEGTFIGYYINSKYYDIQGSSKECFVFFAEKNNSDLYNYLFDIIYRGNTVNSIDNDGNIFLTINIDNIPETDSEIIRQSTVYKPTRLVLKNKELPGKGATACTSFVEIVSVE